MMDRFGLDKIKQGQTLLMVSLIGGLTIVSVVLIYVLFSKSSKPENKTERESYKSSITSGSSRINPKELWVERLSAEQDQNQKRIESLEKQIEELTKKAKEVSDVSQKPSAPDLPDTSPSKNLQNQPNTADEDMIDGLRDDMKQALNDPLIQQGGALSGQNVGGVQPIHSLQDSSSQGLMIMPSAMPKKRPHTKGIQRVSLSLANSRAKKNLKTVDNTIPAGAFAQAVLMGGVDASTSIQASSDPRPVLLRVTNPGTLPRRFRSDLYGCHVLAASYGDISSERVYMRLEKLTCTEWKTGEIVEMNVSGYVAGEDGRAGLRGTVVDRAGESVRNAAIGGFLGGMGSFFSQPNNPITYSLTSGLAQTNTPSTSQLLGQGLAKGAGNALEKYADFYIKRAEQMQPVLQVQAGRMVDIVFTQGVSFEDSAARSTMVHMNDQSRYASLNTSTSESTTQPAESWVSPSPSTSSQGEAS